MHLANCNEHTDKNDPKLSCWQLRHDDGRRVTPDEAMAEIERMREDAARLDWLEQHAWATERECFDFVDAWRTPDGKRHNGGIREAIDATMTPNEKLSSRPPTENKQEQ